MNIFEREEKKYVISRAEFNEILPVLTEHMVWDKYGKQTINSLYFDDEFHLSIQKSISKPVYKEKLRLRSYGTPNQEDLVYLELKKKYRGVVYKRRLEMTLGEANTYLQEGTVKCNSQIFREIDYIRNLYNLKPAVFIAYERVALIGMAEGLRITFDTDVRFRTNDLCLQHENDTTPLTDKDSYVMEIKTPDVLPFWLAKLLNSKKIYPMSFSKYGKIYEKYLA